MPLPEPGTAWPPKQYEPVFKDIEECADWWEGDSDKLAQRYSRGMSAGQALGLRGWLHSLWWGKPLDDNSDRLHMPVAADLAQTSATLLFSEPPTFTVPMPDLGKDADGKPIISEGWQNAQDRLDLIANAAGTRATLLEAAEKCAALGGVYLRVVFDKDTDIKHAFLDVMDADLAIPEWRWGRLVAVTFWSELPSSDKVVWRHLERHSMGRIEHALYMGTRESIGNPVDLTRHTHTEKYAAMLTDAEGYNTGVDGLTVAYVPNLRPNPKWRKDPQLKNLGRSDISPDLIPLFDKVDELWSSLMRDFDIGKGRLFVSEDLLDSRGPGKGSAFNTDTKAFTLTTGGGNDDLMVQAEQFAIRVTEHLEAIDAVIREILRRVGYSPGTFGLVDDGGAMTATEVASKRAASIATKTAKGRLWQAALAPLLRTLLAVDAIQFETGAEVLEDIDVEWPAAYKESDLTRAQTVQAMDAARAISTYEKVAYLHPDWDAAQVQAEADLILSETAIADPFALGADEPMEPAEDDGEPEAEDAESIKKKAEALGMLVRAGVESGDAATRVGLKGAKFTGLLPTSLKEPGSDAAPGPFG